MTAVSAAAFLAEHAPELTVLVTQDSTATVPLAAAAHGVAPGQIAKTLSLWHGDVPVLLVMAGDARIDNQAYKATFGCKARMLSADEALARTGHPVGGVCPFGLTEPLPVYLDRSLLAWEEVLPAAGGTNTAVRLTPSRLADLTGGTWVDVARVAPPA
ncbi:YbaK/EbsC family protein [Miniimonas arenae]|uniref:YbaK/EbsC family protein n=1 Tax=Miniimonas arenae TaxID=676201 RepID=A0A5C5BB41_9MICO|nr:MULTISPECIES: YbaK/EbsC family protein [Miniimonas]TNU73699.1 YbaK/EbsC family protein [Miniimonas arenae]